MAEFSKLVITKKGQKLIAKILEGASENITFTKICSSDTQYENNRLENLEALESIKQENAISHIERKNDVTVSMETLFTNKDLKTGYYMRSVGLYATDPDDGEILYAVTVEKTGQCYIPAHNGTTFTEILIHLVTTVGNAENVSIIVDPSAEATKKDIERLNDRIDKIEIIVEGLQEDIHGNINSVNTKIGEPADDHTKQTVFGKIASVLKRVIGIDDKVGTPSDSATQQTVFGKIKGITDNVSGNLKPMSDKIGQPADTYTQQTVFGKIADLKKFFSDKAVEILNKIVGVDNKVGTSGDSSSSSTLFGRLKKVQETTDTINTSTNTVNSKIGTSSDSSSSNTLFGKIANINHKLSGMSVVRKITRGVGVGQIDRHDNVVDFVVNVSISNTNKVVVIINNDFIGRSAYQQGQGNSFESVSIFGAYAKEITNSKVVMSPAYSSDSEEKTGGTFEYCIIEFY